MPKQQERIEPTLGPAHRLTRRELATILAALHYWQQHALLLFRLDEASPLRTIATNDGAFEALSANEINALCAKINRQ